MRRSGHWTRILLLEWAAALWIGCGGATDAPVSPRFTVSDADQAVVSCRTAHDPLSPFIVEWPAAERTNIEAASRSSQVVVSYVGCNLKVLASCEASGGYDLVETTPASDGFEIADASDLYARLPIGAARLEGYLASERTLRFRYVATGRYEAKDAAPALSGECAGATHVVRGMIVGAFSLDALEHTGGAAEASVAGAGLGGAQDRSARRLRWAGDLEACAGGADDAARCRAILQLQLESIAGPEPEGESKRVAFTVPPPLPPLTLPDLPPGQGQAEGVIRVSKIERSRPEAFYIVQRSGRPAGLDEAISVGLPAEVVAGYRRYRARVKAAEQVVRTRYERLAEIAPLAETSPEAYSEARKRLIAEFDDTINRALEAVREARDQALEGVQRLAPTALRAVVLADLTFERDVDRYLDAMDRHDELMVNYDASGSADEPPPEPRVDHSATIEAARASLKLPPTSVAGQWARYLLGYALSESGEAQAGWEQGFAAVVGAGGPYQVEGLLRAGELAFDSGRFGEAADLYGQAARLGGPGNGYYDKALYKRVWSLFNVGDHAGVVRDGVVLVDYMVGRTRDEKHTAAETFIEVAERLVPGSAERLGGVRALPLAEANPEAVGILADAIARRAVERGSCRAAMEAWDRVLQAAPGSEAAPRALAGLAGCATAAGDDALASAAASALRTQYGPGSEWLKRFFARAAREDRVRDAEAIATLRPARVEPPPQTEGARAADARARATKLAERCARAPAAHQPRWASLAASGAALWLDVRLARPDPATVQVSHASGEAELTALLEPCLTALAPTYFDEASMGVHVLLQVGEPRAPDERPPATASCTDLRPAQVCASRLGGATPRCEVFFSSPAPRTCADRCQAAGWRCADGWDDRGACRRGRHTGCRQALNSHLCLCEALPPAQ